jgi:hypothetical protein
VYNFRVRRYPKHVTLVGNPLILEELLVLDMDKDSLIFLLRGGHLSMEERFARGIWPHPPLEMSALVTMIAEVLEKEEWFPRRWEPAAPDKSIHEGGTIQRIGPRLFIYRAQRHHPLDTTVLAGSSETAFSAAEEAVRHYLRWDLNLPGKLDSWTVIDA